MRHHDKTFRVDRFQGTTGWPEVFVGCTFGGSTSHADTPNQFFSVTSTVHFYNSDIANRLSALPQRVSEYQREFEQLHVKNKSQKTDLMFSMLHESF